MRSFVRHVLDSELSSTTVESVKTILFLVKSSLGVKGLHFDYLKTLTQIIAIYTALGIRELESSCSVAVRDDLDCIVSVLCRARNF